MNYFNGLMENIADSTTINGKFYDHNAVFEMQKTREKGVIIFLTYLKNF